MWGTGGHPAISLTSPRRCQRWIETMSTAWGPMYPANTPRSYRRHCGPMCATGCRRCPTSGARPTRGPMWPANAPEATARLLPSPLWVLCGRAPPPRGPMWPPSSRSTASEGPPRTNVLRRQTSQVRHRARSESRQQSTRTHRRARAGADARAVLRIASPLELRLFAGPDHLIPADYAGEPWITGRHLPADRPV
jgi:hypothetical protein